MKDNSEFEVKIIHYFNDNYAYIIESEKNAVVVDPGDAQSVLTYLYKNNLSLCAVLSTHHHSDHTSGNRELKEKTGCLIYGFGNCIPAIDHQVLDNEQLMIKNLHFSVMHTPGHTLDSVCYGVISRLKNVLFTGDTLFSYGCGRLFEGSSEMMFNSFQKICALKDNTLIYPGHEYAFDNLVFANSLEPENKEFINKIKTLEKLNNDMAHQVPTILSQEKKFNPYMRVCDSSYKRKLKKENLGSCELFGLLRKMKDSFN